jgi:hypothetical protein
MDALLEEDLDLYGLVAIPAAEYEALTQLESQVRRIAAKRTPVSRDSLSVLLRRIQFARSY